MKGYKSLLAILATLIMPVIIFTGTGREVEAASYFNAYEKAPYETTSNDFSLTVDGKQVDVVTYFQGREGEFAYAHLAYEGTAAFQIKSLGGTITNYNLSPHSYGIQANLSGSNLTFDLAQSGSRYLILQASIGGRQKMLVIAADPKENYDRYLNVNRVVDVTKAPYNADNTGTAYASATIQQAINDVSAAGGGTVYVPKGVYKIVYIDGADNVTLYLDAGAFLRGSGDRNDYTWNETGANGRQGRRDIDIKASKNFAIVGRGVIDGNSLALVKDKGSNGIDGWDDFRKGIVDGNGASGFYMDGVTVKDSAGWTFCIEKSSDITIRNIKLLADYTFIHTDGYDFVSCQNVTISECLGICGDDVFCPKSSYEGSEMLNYLIENGVAFAHGGAGCKVGMQARERTDNIVFRNIDVIQGYRGFSVAHDTGSGNFSNIVFEDIRTEKLNTHTGTSGQFQAAPFIIWTLADKNNGATVDGVQITRCSFENDANIKSLIQGSQSANSWVRNVTITDTTVEGVLITENNYTDYVRHGSNISNIKYVNTGGSSSGNRTVYEAENADVRDGAEIVDKDIASGKKIVGNIGGEGKTNGKVIFTVNSPVEGKANLVIYYLLNGNNRTFYVTVNGGNAVGVDCTGNNWNEIRTAELEVDLNKGSNTIKLDNGAVNEWAPNLDKIELQYTMVYEAENADVRDGAEIVDKDIASGKKIVGNIGGAGKTNGKVIFTVDAPSSGKAYLDIYYLLNGNRTFYVTTNGGDAVGVDCAGDNWNRVVKKTIEIQLNQGSNTIKLDNGARDEWAPNLDKIEIKMQ